MANANLNLEENSQRKAILNAMMGTRVFRGSALSRAVRGNTPGVGGEQAAPAPSASQLSNSSPVSTASLASLLDTRGIGNTSAGGGSAVTAGGSTSGGIAGGYAGGGNSRGGTSGRA